MPQRHEGTKKKIAGKKRRRFCFRHKVGKAFAFFFFPPPRLKANYYRFKIKNCPDISRGSTAECRNRDELLFYNFHGFGSVCISDKLYIINAGS
jgi:hypothetical protein